MTASPAAAVALAKPKVGGIYNNVPFTGGMRDLLLARSFSLRPYMERDRITVMKVLKDCDSGIKFKLKKRRRVAYTHLKLRSTTPASRTTVVIQSSTC